MVYRKPFTDILSGYRKKMGFEKGTLEAFRKTIHLPDDYFFEKGNKKKRGRSKPRKLSPDILGF